VSADSDEVASDALAVEAEVVGTEVTILAEEFSEFASDTAVVSSRVTRVAAEIVVECTQTVVELLEDDGLKFDFANLLSDHPLCHLLKDNKPLLDDLDLLSAADDLVLVDNDGLGVPRTVPVVGAVEVIETV